jgi:predicted ABC-type ATPase
VKDVIVLGGPNGAGKSTAVPSVIPPKLGIVEFVNADEIARGLSPLNPAGSEIAAGRLLIERIHTLKNSGQSFGFETTCAGRSHAGLLRECRATGYRVTLIFLWLPSPSASLKRVARRVREGGHDVDGDVVTRRYWAGLRNLHSLYLPLADLALVYDNSDTGRVLVYEATSAERIVHDPQRWRKIQKAAS